MRRRMSSSLPEKETALGLRHGPAPGWKRLRLTVAYCGTLWRGWQSQDGGGGIQDEINKAIAKATGITTSVQGSGRTDAGVHALAQIAHGDVPETVRMSGASWTDALNACLPPTIRITQVEDAHPQFHARARCPKAPGCSASGRLISSPHASVTVPLRCVSARLAVAAGNDSNAERSGRTNCLCDGPHHRPPSAGFCRLMAPVTPSPHAAAASDI